ncbi:MAG: hypothetical protein R3C26_19035 [Calditrichia bacterium]
MPPAPYVGGRPAPFTDDPTTAPGVEDYFLLDVNVGYDLHNVMHGLRADLNIYNALDKPPSRVCRCTGNRSHGNGSFGLYSKN